MKKENSKFDLLYILILFFALMSTAQLLISAIDLLSFKSKPPYVSGLGEVYSNSFYTDVSILTIVSAVASIIVLSLFVFYFFAKNKTTNRTRNFLIIIESIFIIGLIVLMVLIRNFVPAYWAAPEYTKIYDIELYSSVQSMFTQQLVVFSVLFGMVIYQTIKNKKTIEQVGTVEHNESE